jgi:hypothetical protein
MIKYSKKEISKLNNDNTGGVGTEVSNTETKVDKNFPIIGFEQGFEDLNSKYMIIHTIEIGLKYLEQYFPI